MPLDASAQQVCDLLAQVEGPPLSDLTPDQLRLQYEALGAMSAGEGADVASVVEREIAGVPVRVVTPLGTGPFPVLVWFHGGGWVIGSAALSVPLCRDLAAEAGCVVVSVDYRLAPEHPFPAGLDDANAVVEWVLAHAADVGGDPSRVAVGGDSAGGNLAAVIAPEVGELVYQLLVYPVTDATCGHRSYEENAAGYLLEAETMRWFIAHYLSSPDAPGRDDPRVSPLFASAESLSRAPAAHVITAGYDPLHDEGVAYASRLRDAGVDVDHVDYPGQIHGFVSMSAVIPDGAAAKSAAAAALRRAFAS